MRYFAAEGGTTVLSVQMAGADIKNGVAFVSDSVPTGVAGKKDLGKCTRTGNGEQNGGYSYYARQGFRVIA